MLKVDILIELSSGAMATDAKKMELYAVQAKELAEKVGYKSGFAHANRYLGLAHCFQSNYGEAVDSWQKGLNMFDSIGDKMNVARLYSNIGAVYFNQYDDVKALEYYLQSQRVAEEIQDTGRIITALGNIGAIYGKKKVTYDKALEFHHKGLKIGEAIKDNNSIGTLCANIGEIYMNMNQDSLALKYFLRSLEAHEGTENESTNTDGLHRRASKCRQGICQALRTRRNDQCYCRSDIEYRIND